MEDFWDSMNLHLPFDLDVSASVFMRRAGYAEFRDPNTGITSYTKRLSRGDFYPRFHVYIEEVDNLPMVKLHLDQKRPSYAGAHAHNAEYEGPVVEKEINRLKQLLSLYKNQ